MTSDLQGPDSEAPDIADFCALGRFLYHAARAGPNAVVLRLLQAQGSPPAIDTRALESLQRSVADILEDLPSRQRIIVERYDFAGDRHTTVAAELGISIRHFWRELREAHHRIAEALGHRTTLPTISATLPKSDELAAHLRLSEVLENNGRWQEGAALLEGASNKTSLPEQRLQIELRLSNLYVEVERYSLSSHHAKAARAVADRLEPSQRWRSFEVDVMFARICYFTGNCARAFDILHGSIAQLRSWMHNTQGVETALVDALCLQVDLYCDRGNWQLARQAANDACTIIEHSSQLTPHVYFAARWRSALVDLLQSARLADLRRDLFQSHTDAIDHGLTRDALHAAASISQSYRLEQRPEEAIGVLTPLLETARNVGRCQAFVELFMQMIQAHIELGGYATARNYLLELAANAGNSQGALSLMDARLLFGLRDFESALSAAERAEEIFTRDGADRLVAVALLEQANALVALGRYDHARRVLPVAIEMSESAKQPSFRVAMAYDLLAKATGQPKYAAQARKLRALEHPLDA